MVGRRVVDFAVNSISGGVSILLHEGFKRPVDAGSDPTGASTWPTGVRRGRHQSEPASKSASAQACCGASVRPVTATATYRLSLDPRASSSSDVMNAEE
jgi:hypothetical protein